MNDILVDPDHPGGKERKPLMIESAKFCQWHNALTWECYCGRPKIDVEVRVYER